MPDFAPQLALKNNVQNFPAPQLYAEILKIARHAHWSRREQIVALAELLARLFAEATKQENLAFSTLFSRISYAGHKFNFQPETLRAVHFFRKISERVRANPDPDFAREKDLQLGLRASAETVLVLSGGAAIPAELLDFLVVADGQEFASPEIWDFKSRARGVAVADDPDNFCLIFLDEEQPERPVRVRYQIADRNDNFTRSIQSIRRTFGFPVTLNLLDVDIDRHGEYRPRAFVLEPDFLVDVSAVAECFKEHGAEPLAYLVKKFVPTETTPQILLGNMANHFLDRLLTEPTATWRELLAETFQLYPFVFAPMSDAEVKDIADKSQRHFQSIREMAEGGGFAREGIDPAGCFLEPTFFSEQYGLQGRLDLFFMGNNVGRVSNPSDVQSKVAAIVELKSGKLWKPNSYGINRSHFTQTLLYDLLIRSVFGSQLEPAKYIFYSGLEMQQLRFAPTVRAEQFEALQVRNQLVSIERRLANIRPGEAEVTMFSQLRQEAAKGDNFLGRDFGQFEQVYAPLSVLEKKYFNAFAGFIAREQLLAKIGEDDSANSNGHAALWRNSFAQKQETFGILSHLQIIDNQADAPDPFILFEKSETTNPLANFRRGDIVVLYSADSEMDTVLDSQVIRGTITELSPTQVRVQLRFRQFNLNPFRTAAGAFWNLESDMMEIGFGNQHRSLFEWAGSGAARRDLLLGKTAPEGSRKEAKTQSREQVNEGPDFGNFSNFRNLTLTAEQQEIFQKIIASQDYFLLWGPPGTGKTSVMLRALAAHWLLNSEENLLILAYTNRAVDEICEAIESIGHPEIQDLYLRIGSRFSTAERFRGQLLNAKIAGAKNRAELRAVLERHRIFVGTVASFASNEGVLRLKKFNRLVVDEASQLLEPQLLGLLSRFEHFTLIGDHRQLPAITQQPTEQSAVPPDELDLRSIGLTDLRDSYFERLYRRCVAEGWDWAFSKLSRQGRMHADIMDFPNQKFYGGFLKVLDDEGEQPRHFNHEKPMPSTRDKNAQSPPLRVVFQKIPPAENALPGQKTSHSEAEAIAEAVQFFKNRWAENGRDWHPNTLGIITPWRAQIAQIRASLLARALDPDEFSIDTVERYQGGARDVILVSTCVHSPGQLAQLVSLSGEGVDRKLNVALTRAREHVWVLGNWEILRLDERYRAFGELYSNDAHAPA